MSREKPDHHDAELVIRVYELRREAKTRESRDKINGQFWPKSYDDVKAVAQQSDHPMNAAFRQMGTYWEMVFGIARHGIVNADYWVENNGEGFFLLAKVAPYLEQIRRESSPRAFQNLEWAATQTNTGRQIYASIEERVKRVLASK